MPIHNQIDFPQIGLESFPEAQETFHVVIDQRQDGAARHNAVEDVTRGAQGRQTMHSADVERKKRRVSFVAQICHGTVASELSLEPRTCDH